ncbi:sulfotransferase domain-containing protein [Actinocorallia sp. API 0066]|uniref:sulfotransferase domain-containing protein n=1 Tax=Actinocorallia sp. API 0066 TaxID=2896846 RepID=UPI001E537EB8|nr:sulfotransferase domain-containing protein [Actinocorallia sp. API 0066]MCD0447816.1 sulfotransferase domain-containing protein [Actinocorallia sp. API 0066]
MADGLAGRLKDVSPRWVKDLANTGTRAYAVRTASRRHLPDFMIVGTKRGGTTSMWNYLVRHPHVMPMYPPSRGLKSPWYFYANYAEGDDWYRSHFATEAELDRAEARTGVRPLTGEACPYYLYDPRIPGRVHAMMPELKAVILLRDPVKRAYSHFWERTGEGDETLTFEEALAAEPARTAGELDRMEADPYYYGRAHDYFSYRDRGVYLPQLQRWAALFGRERMLVMSAEEMYADEQRGLDKVCAFLGLPAHPMRAARRHNHLPAPPMNSTTREELTEFYRPHNRALFSWLGEDYGWPA